MLRSYPWLDQSQLIGSDVADTGWHWMIEGLLKDLDAVLADTGATLVVLQVKEKLGSLRFYHRLRNTSESQEARIKELMENAYQTSRRTCIVCGDSGDIRHLPPGLIWPLCDAHNNEDARDLVP